MRFSTKKVRRFWANTKKWYSKKMSNCRYEIRYNNLITKYEELEEKMKEVLKKIDEDTNLKEIENLKSQVKRQKNINKNITRDYKILEEKIKENKNGK